MSGNDQDEDQPSLRAQIAAPLANHGPPTRMQELIAKTSPVRGVRCAATRSSITGLPAAASTRKDDRRTTSCRNATRTSSNFSPSKTCR